MGYKARLLPRVPDLGYTMLNHGYKKYLFVAGGDAQDIADDDVQYFRTKRGEKGRGSGPGEMPLAFQVWRDNEPTPEIPEHIVLFKMGRQNGAMTTQDLQQQSAAHKGEVDGLKAQVAQLADMVKALTESLSKQAAAPTPAPAPVDPIKEAHPTVSDDAVVRANLEMLSAKFGPSKREQKAAEKGKR